MFKKILIFLSLSLLLSACQFKIPFLDKKKAGLQVTSTPQATVMFDGTSLGTTPLVKEDLEPGQYTLKLTPQDPQLSPWQTNVTLSSGILTVVDRKLSNNSDQNHGYILSFEELSSKNDTEIAISTLPDSANVSVDGAPKGFTPISLDTIQAGEHVIALTSPGYKDKTIRARNLPGYRLTISAQLSQQTDLQEPVLGTQSAQAEDSSFDPAQYSIQVLNGTGTPGQAGQVQDLLNKAGFESIDTANANTYDYQQTQISLHPDAADQLFEVLKDALSESFSASLSAQLNPDSNYDAVITTGEK